MRRLLLIAILAAITGTATLFAHHSFAAYYFADQTISIEGNIEEFDYVNPHVWVKIVAPDKQGRPQKVAAEWAPPGRLAQQGIVKETLKPGDHVVVTGRPSRDLAFKIQLTRIYRASDGWTWVGQNDRR